MSGQPTDVELAAQVSAGNVAAWGDLFQRHREAVQAHARRFTRCQADADALVSDVFMSVFGALTRREEPMSYFSVAYLLRTARNLAVSNARRERNHISLDLPDRSIDVAQPDSGDGTMFEVETNPELKILLWRAFWRLEPRRRAVFYLREIDGHSYKEIALLLRVKASNASTMVHRARKDFRNHYADAVAQSKRVNAARARIFDSHIGR